MFSIRKYGKLRTSQEDPYVKEIPVICPGGLRPAETTRMIEIAKGVRNHPAASKVFDLQFISDGGDFEHLIEEEGFSLKRLEPRLIEQKIEHIARVDRGEKFAPDLSQVELITMIENEAAYLKQLKPAAVITGSYMTMPVTCRILHIPLVWVIQSTWLEDFFTKGAGMTDRIGFKPVKMIADWVIFLFINFWIRYGFVNPINKAAKHFGVKGYASIFDYYRGEITIVAEPAELTGVRLPEGYYYTGPLIARQDFPIPKDVQSLSRDLPLVYFAMGSSGTPEIVAKLIESFKGQPYRVVAPVKFQLNKVPGVKVPPNVLVTDWLPALQVNKLADLTVIHGDIGTVMIAPYAGEPVVGIGMQPEQDANIAGLVRKWFAIRVPKSNHPSTKMQKAIRLLLQDEAAKRKPEEFSKVMGKWDGPKMAAELLLEKLGK